MSKARGLYLFHMQKLLDMKATSEFILTLRAVHSLTAVY